MQSSTPVLVNRFLSKHNLHTDSPPKDQSQDMSFTEDDNPPTEDPSPANVSSFFCNNLESNNQIDAFEKSIDFKNMNDVIDLSSESDNSSDEDKPAFGGDSSDLEDNKKDVFEIMEANDGGTCQWDLSFAWKRPQFEI